MKVLFLFDWSSIIFMRVIPDSLINKQGLFHQSSGFSSSITFLQDQNLDCC